MFHARTCSFAPPPFRPPPPPPSHPSHPPKNLKLSSYEWVEIRINPHRRDWFQTSPFQTQLSGRRFPHSLARGQTGAVSFHLRCLRLPPSLRLPPPLVPPLVLEQPRDSLFNSPTVTAVPLKRFIFFYAFSYPDPFERIQAVCIPVWDLLSSGFATVSLGFGCYYNRRESFCVSNPHRPVHVYVVAD